MGFGFNLFVAFLLLPLTLIFLMFYFFTRKKSWGKLLLFMWVPIVGLVTLASIIKLITGQKQVERSDIYGEYVIDTAKYSGKQAKWQYDHFRLIIQEDNTFTFYQMNDDGKAIIKISGEAKFIDGYVSPHLVLQPNGATHHIIKEPPTLHRNTFSFYYVLYSGKFGNVFFTKGRWSAKKR